MEKVPIMQDKITNLFGWSSTAGAFGLNVQAWLIDLNINQGLTIGISILSLIFLVMKMYDQYLITKKRKQDGNL